MELPPDVPHGAPVGQAPAPAGVGDAAAATTGASVLSGGLWSALNLFLPQVYTLILSVVAARVLGPEGMGRQSFISFVEISTTALLTGGLPVSVMRHVGEAMGEGRPERVRRLIAWAWRIECVAALVGAGAVAAIGLTRSNLQSAWVLAAVAAALSLLQTVPSAVLIGVQRWRQAAVAGLVTGAVGLAAAVAVLAAGGGIVGLFAVEAATSALNLAWTTWLARRAVPEAGPGPADSDLIRRARNYAAVGTLQVLVFFVVQRRTEFFFLNRYSTAKQIAVYSIAFSATAALVRIPQALAGVLAPAVATLFGARQHDRIQVGFGRAVRLMTLMTLALTGATVALGPAALRLVYGRQYRATGPVLMVMVLAMPAIPLSSVSQAVLAGLGRQKVPLAIGVAASVVNLTFDAVLIPRHAAVGAAVANGLAQVALSVPMLVYACRSVGSIRWEAPTLARGAVAAGAVAAAGWGVTAHVHGWVGLAGGLLACAAALALLAPALRLLPASDARWLDEAAGDRLGGLVGAACRACSTTPD